jgi:hypothetical protein
VHDRHGYVQEERSEIADIVEEIDRLVGDQKKPAIEQDRIFFRPSIHRVRNPFFQLRSVRQQDAAASKEDSAEDVRGVMKAEVDSRDQDNGQDVDDRKESKAAGSQEDACNQSAEERRMVAGERTPPLENIRRDPDGGGKWRPG